MARNRLRLQSLQTRHEMGRVGLMLGLTVLAVIAGLVAAGCNPSRKVDHRLATVDDIDLPELLSAVAARHAAGCHRFSGHFRQRG